MFNIAFHSKSISKMFYKVRLEEKNTKPKNIAMIS